MDRARPRRYGEVGGRLIREGVDGQVDAIAGNRGEEQLRSAPRRRSCGLGGAMVHRWSLVLESGIDAVGLNERVGGLRGTPPHLGPRRHTAATRLQRFVNPRARTRSHRTESGFIVVLCGGGQGKGGRKRFRGGARRAGPHVRAARRIPDGGRGDGGGAVSSEQCKERGMADGRWGGGSRQARRQTAKV